MIKVERVMISKRYQPLQYTPARQQRARDDWYAGTADAVYQNLRVLGEQEPEYLLVLAGDHVKFRKFCR